jgi:hypothetical protein
MSDNKISEDSIKIGRFDDDQNYIRITPKESIRNHIVALVTEMFCSGDLTVLIGTQALLGEGWDAPAINSLILSSTVSSYMLSNQMRGRAIRIDKHNPDKVSNIWHLATIDFPDKNDFSKFGTISDNDLEDFKIYTSDLVQLDTRFKGFEAPSYYGNHEIMSGIERILDDPSLREVALKKSVEKLKDNTLKLAKNRELIRQWWNDALYLGYGQNKVTNLSTGVEVPRLTTKSLLFYGYKSMVLSFLATVLVFYYFLLRIIPFFFLTTLALVVVAIFLGIMSAKYLKTGTVEGVLKQVSIVILETMSSQGLIKSSIKNVGLHVTEVQGSVFVSCSNLPAEENNLFIQALQELLDPIDNPRYLLIKHSKFLGRVKQTDYFAVPSILSTKKKSVEIFQKLWKKYIGECEIVYTRNLDGRKVLLKARKNASSTMKRKRSKRLSKWQ